MRYDSSVASNAPATDDGLSAFERARPRLFGIAYRMLGSVAEAEDIVQDVWTRWQSTDRGVVRDPQAFLATTTTRLAINVLQLRARGTKRTSGRGFPNRSIPALIQHWAPSAVRRWSSRSSCCSNGCRRRERAAYVLREAFNYPYKEIAEVLRVEEANARQLVTRARQHVTDERRARVSNDEQKRLLHAFVAAAQTGDLAALERLFAADVVSQADGGGFIRAAQKPVVGRERVAKYIAAVSEMGLDRCHRHRD